MMFSKYRILFKIGESIVHPSHIPLEIESETARKGGFRYPFPGGGLLCKCKNAGIVGGGNFVQRLKKIDRIQVFRTAKTVRDPVVFGFEEIELEHGIT